MGMLDRYLMPLYMLYFTDGEIKGRTRFQKLIFLTKENSSPKVEITFTPLFYGPFSRDLMDTIEAHIKEGFITEAFEEGTNGIIYIYKLTDNGKSVVEESLKKGLLDDQIKTKITEIASEFGKKPLNELIATVYKEYPEYCSKHH